MQINNLTSYTKPQSEMLLILMGFISAVKTVKDSQLLPIRNSRSVIPVSYTHLRGGVNVSIAICMFVCYMIIVNIPLFL